MNDHSTDELRLRATEAQMRRALGLDGSATPGPQTAVTTQPVTAGASNVHRRHFVRDGEVPVSVIHRDHENGGTNKLDAARQALREQIAAREQAERMLVEAQASVQALETKIAHERIAKDEAVGRIEVARLQMEQALQTTLKQLAAERHERQQAEQERDEAITARQNAEERLRAMTVIEQAYKPATVSKRARTGRAAVMVESSGKKPASVPETAPTKTLTDRGYNVEQPRPRGRPPKVKEPESEFVEWWKPGWQDRYRSNR